MGNSSSAAVDRLVVSEHGATLHVMDCRYPITGAVISVEEDAIHIQHFGSSLFHYLNHVSFSVKVVLLGLKHTTVYVYPREKSAVCVYLPLPQ